MLIDISVQLSPIVQEPHKCQYCDRWDKADLFSYYQLTGRYLQNTEVPSMLFNDSVAPDNHAKLINDYYTNIINALLCASSVSVPKIKAF